MVVPRFGRWTVGAAVALVIALFSFTACNAEGSADPDTPPGPPTYLGAELDSTKKIVTLSFDRGISAVSTPEALKKAVFLAPKGTGTAFSVLAANDTVQIADPPDTHHLVVTFAAPLTGDKNILRVAPNSLRGTDDKIRITTEIITDSIAAGTPPVSDPETGTPETGTPGNGTPGTETSGTDPPESEPPTAAETLLAELKAAAAGTLDAATITGDEITIGPASPNFTITADLTVPSGVTLTFAPGSSGTISSTITFKQGATYNMFSTALVTGSGANPGKVRLEWASKLYLAGANGVPYLWIGNGINNEPALELGSGDAIAEFSTKNNGATTVTTFVIGAFAFCGTAPNAVAPGDHDIPENEEIVVTLSCTVTIRPGVTIYIDGTLTFADGAVFQHYGNTVFGDTGSITFVHGTSVKMVQEASWRRFIATETYEAATTTIRLLTPGGTVVRSKDTYVFNSDALLSNGPGDLNFWDDEATLASEILAPTTYKWINEKWIEQVDS
jgi:hypothetical protein